MTFEELQRLAEELSRPARILRAEPTGEAPEGWNYPGSLGGPQFAVRRGDEVLLVFVDGEDVARASKVPEAPAGGVPLYGRDVRSYPPFDAIYRLGGPVVRTWVASRGHDHGEVFEGTVPDPAFDRYEAWWQDRFPLYDPEPAIVLGGWHFPWPDGDWSDLVQSTFVAWRTTGEPFLELWQVDGGYRVIERLT